MKTILRIFAVISALAAMALIGLATGCATVGDGKLEPLTKGTAKAALTAAKLAKAKAEANGQLPKRIENIESVLGIRE